MSNEEAVAMLDAVQHAAELGDDEAARGAESALHVRALEAIMRGEGDTIALAAIALTSRQYKFHRG